MMPTYVYGVILSEEDDEAIGDVFEVEQGIRDQPLTRHPETGQPVRRLLCAPYIAGTWSPMKMKKSMADNTLAKRGFTKYVKTGDGYEKTVGKGPDLLPKSSGK
jgi:predicted nucleic acid-binding Zn ribbon protein